MRILSLAVVALLVAGFAQAAEKKTKTIKHHAQDFAAASNSGGMHHNLAGCGLGSMLIDSGEKWPQVGAAFLNGTSGSQTFGITSGTSNCVEDGVAEASREKDFFVEANYADLQRDVAVGSGAYLSSLASLYGCKGESALGFGQALHKNQSKVLGASPANASQVIDDVVRSEKASCQG